MSIADLNFANSYSYRHDSLPKLMNDRPQILKKIKRYYRDKLVRHGATPQGVDWDSASSQQLRFEQLSKILRTPARFSINDYGCGYGELYTFLASRHEDFDYLGCDASEDMVAEARRRHPAEALPRFIVGDRFERVADYTVASGVFSVRLDISIPEWEGHLFETLGLLDASSRLGFSFNCLTTYSDEERKRDDLYYASPSRLFDYCKKNFARNVALLHDYGLYEFTVLVRKADI